METSGFSPEPPRPAPKLITLPGCLLGLVTLFLLFGVSLGPIHIGPLHARQNVWVQEAHLIGLALYSCANDNDQMYPDASSSTELFQKLLDGGYITDPSVFYIPMPGKTPAVPGQKLKPENVCWDVTEPTDVTKAQDLPVVFMTGYKINYVPGGAATPVIKPAPQYEADGPPPTWLERTFEGQLINYAPSTGFAVFYDNNSCAFHPAAPDATIPNVVSTEYKPDGTTYRQLTPDGVLR